MIRFIRVRSFETGLVFRDREFDGLLEPGFYVRFDPLGRETVKIVSQRDPWLEHEQLDVIIRSGALDGRAVVLDLKDRERGLVWIDDRFAAVLPPGRYALWTGFRRVHSEVADARTIRFDHPNLEAVLRGTCASEQLDVQDVSADHAGVLFVDGRYVETLGPGRYAFWKNLAAVKLVRVDRRESVLDVTGQDVLTADKVTLRINAVVTYRVADALKSVTAVDNAVQALYREAQLALRAAVGTREFDALLAEKEPLAAELTDRLRPRAAEFGIAVGALGLRDVILPGDMKDLMNKVLEARKAAEAAVITRREEAAALRHQLNAAKLLAENPTLLRLRELEAVEKIAAESELKVILGEKGLAERVVGML